MRRALLRPAPLYLAVNLMNDGDREDTDLSARRFLPILSHYQQNNFGDFGSFDNGAHTACQCGNREQCRSATQM